MKNGYDQFFKQARKVAFEDAPRSGSAKINLDQLQKKAAQDSNRMAKDLRQRLRPQLNKKKSTGIPWKLTISSLVGFLIAGAGLWKLDEIETFFKKVEITLMGSAFAEDKKPDMKKSDAKDEAKAAEAKAAASAEARKEEGTNHLAKLNDRKKELDAREEELNRMEAELQLQKAELEKKLAELEGTRRNIASVLEDKVKVDDQKVETLVQMYSNMKPQQAAKVFETMDEDLAVEILGRMKKKSAAEIMNLVKAEKAQVFSEKYAGYKKK